MRERYAIGWQTPNYFTRIGRNRCQLRAKRAARRRRRGFGYASRGNTRSFWLPSLSRESSTFFVHLNGSFARASHAAMRLRNVGPDIRWEPRRESSNLWPPMRFHCHVYYRSAGGSGLFRRDIFEAGCNVPDTSSIGPMRCFNHNRKSSSRTDGTI